VPKNASFCVILAQFSLLHPANFIRTPALRCASTLTDNFIDSPAYGRKPRRSNVFMNFENNRRQGSESNPRDYSLPEPCRQGRLRAPSNPCYWAQSMLKCQPPDAPGTGTADLLKQISDLKMCNLSPGGRDRKRSAARCYHSLFARRSIKYQVCPHNSPQTNFKMVRLGSFCSL
jgi:hypothetical protein